MKKFLFSTSLMVALTASTAAMAGGSHESYNNNSVYRSDNSTDSMAREDVRRAPSSWYLTVAGVDNILGDEDAGIGATAGNIDFDNGWGALVAVGHQMDWGWMKGMRGELELGWRKNEADSYTTGGVTSNASGDLNSYSLMANTYYDFVNSSAITPYIGVGIGAADIDARNITATGVAGSLDDNDITFAYQGIAGVGFELNNKWTLQTEYRYFATTDANMTTSTGASTDLSYDSHNVIVGLKYSFY